MTPRLLLLRRCTEKNVDGRITRYCYDGGHVIAEYDGTYDCGALLRKYIYGPGVDEPICMIEVAGMCLARQLNQQFPDVARAASP